MNKLELNKFGQWLARDVRDRSVDGLTEFMTNPASERAREIVASLSMPQFATNDQLGRFLALAVDWTIDQLMRSIEDSKFIHVVIAMKQGSAIDVSEISDGLAGELYSKNGWFAQFSKLGKSVLDR